MALNKKRNVYIARGLVDRVRNVDCEKIGAGQEAIDGLKLDMIGIDVPWMIPSKICHRSNGCVVDALRFRADECVFAIRLVPNRYDNEPLLGLHLFRQAEKCD